MAITTKLPRRSFWIRTTATAAIAAIANVGIYYVTAALGWFQTTLLVETLGSPIPVTLVAVASITSILIAASLKTLLMRFTQSHQRLFLAIALLILISSFVAPLTIPGAALSMKLSLVAMHVVGGIIAIIGLNV